MHRFRLPSSLIYASSLVAVAIATSTIHTGAQGQTTAASRGQATPPPARGANMAQTTLSATTRQQLMASLDKGAKYLKKTQGADGRWEEHPGITALAAAVLLQQPGVTHAVAMQTVGKSLDVIAKLAKPDGGIYQKDIPHYITAVSVMALVAGGRPTDKPIIEKARAYLVEHLLDEDEGVQPSDKFYGGMGYGGTSDGGKADMISLEYGLRAMKAADLPANSDAWEKAIKFIQRSQNNSETNDQKWAANDGGLIYYPGYSQDQGSTRSYGSASYVGILSYTWANVQKTDPRVQAVLKWVKNNYTVDENPGIGQHTIYYYYMVFAKALQAVGEPVVIDAKGVRHNWREDLAKKLISLQHADGYWVNDKDPGEMQDNKVLVTCFTMEAIESILK